MISRLLGVLLITSIALTGCGSDKKEPTAEPTASLPTGNVNVPSGVTLTKAGAKLAFGEAATVAYEPNPERNTVLELTVVSVQQGAVTDLGGYVLDDRTKASTPYYVQVTAKNVGDGDIGNTPIPLWAVDDKDTLIQASSFTNAFAKCPSTPLPASFAPSDEQTSCLVYLVPDHGTLTGVSFRPLQAYAPILWTGEITVPPTPSAKPTPQATATP